MANENSAAKPKTLQRKFLRLVAIAGVSVVVIVLLVGGIWRFSGSNQWELVGEKKGVKIYSLKAPGSDSQKFKCVFRVHSTLAGLVRLMRDPDACDDMGCYESHIVDRIDDQLQYSTFRYKLPAPFLPREFVVRILVHQSPGTGEVLVNYGAALGKTPPNDCCVRVSDMNNTWRLTPLGNGEVDVEVIMDMNEGGFVPNLVLNAARPRALFKVLPNIQRILNKEKYQTAKLDFIKER